MAEVKDDAQVTVPQKQSSTVNIVPVQMQRIRQDVSTRKAAINEAEWAYWPYRVKLQQMYLNTKDNGHITACWEKRRDLTLLRRFEILTPAGTQDEKTALIFCNKKKNSLTPKKWFNNFVSHALDALLYGYSPIHLGDIVNNEFPKVRVVKRWNVSPDRIEINNFPYMPNGTKFTEDAKYKNWYVYVDTPNETGVSICGYGLLWDVSIIEIFLRNLLGFNGDFVEMFAQPYRHGKTTKTNETERAAFEAAVAAMGSAGYVITDPTDEIEFIETALGGTGYKGYDNLEARLMKMASKVLLGHADAIDSVPGKLGNSNDKSPAEKSLEEKQSKDGLFIESIVQDLLFNNLRNLGFNIPEGTVFAYKNDAEVMENANAIVDLAVKMKSAGLQMTSEEFTKQSGIASEPIAVAPIIKGDFNKGKPGEKAKAPKVAAFSRNVNAKLKAYYAS